MISTTSWLWKAGASRLYPEPTRKPETRPRDTLDPTAKGDSINKVSVLSQTVPCSLFSFLLTRL